MNFEWLIRIFKKKRNLIQAQAGPEEVAPVKNSITLRLREEASTIITMWRFLLHPTNKQASDAHKQEFKKIEKDFGNQVQMNLKSDGDKSITLELSKGFHDRWVNQAIDRAFNQQHPRLTKDQANALNELYRELNNDKNHPRFSAY